MLDSLVALEGRQAKMYHPGHGYSLNFSGNIIKIRFAI